MQIPADGALAYTLDQAAHVCSVSRVYLHQAIKRGDLQAKRLTPARDRHSPPRGRYLILRKDLEAWLETLPDDWAYDMY